MDVSMAAGATVATGVDGETVVDAITAADAAVDGVSVVVVVVVSECWDDKNDNFFSTKHTFFGTTERNRRLVLRRYNFFGSFAFSH